MASPGDVTLASLTGRPGSHAAPAACGTVTSAKPATRTKDRRSGIRLIFDRPPGEPEGSGLLVYCLPRDPSNRVPAPVVSSPGSGPPGSWARREADRGSSGTGTAPPL